MLRPRHRGFTLIELMVVLAIIGILLLLGTPLFTTFMANSRIKTASEAFANALVQARTEAIKRNEPVEFVISSGWLVCLVADDASCTQGDASVLYQGAGREGTSDVVVTPTPADATRITFDSLGRIIAPNPADDSDALTQVDIDVTNGTSVNSRPLRVVVETGGGVRLCDPAVSSPNPAACV